MQLELLDRQPARGAKKRPPLLFIHGSFASAWLWDEHFLGFFAEAGYPSYALSLRGHGNSDGREDLAHASLADYAADVALAARRIGTAPILIGHSMGGAVAMKALETQEASGLVLMNSVSPHGLLSSAAYLAWQRPWLYQQVFLLQTLGPGAASKSALKDLLFAQPLSEEREARFLAGMQMESRRVVLDLMGFGLPSFRHDRAFPVMVMGAEHDVMVPRSDVETTARRFGAEPIIVPGLGHAMMLERDWHLAAEALQAWLEGR